MQCGFFDTGRREYVITDFRTPVKWINYIGSRKFGGFVDHTGGTLLCGGDPAYNRITKYLPQLPASDFKGETLYLRLREGEGYRLLAPFVVPCGTEPSAYACRVGLGYSRFTAEFPGIRCEVLVFVPEGTDCEIRDVRIANCGPAPLDLDCVPVVEYSHFDALKQFTNADWVPQTMQSATAGGDGQPHTLFQYAFMRKAGPVNYFTSNGIADSFETDRRRFLGRNEYAGWRFPASLCEESLPCTRALRGDNIAALLHRFVGISPGESVRLVTQLGQAENTHAALETAARFRDMGEVDRAFAHLRDSWRQLLERFTVDTPSGPMNDMLNAFGPRQCQITADWSRDLSLYQLGFGGRGVGVRDTSQDMLGICDRSPGKVEENLLRLLSVQRPQGSSYHQFDSATMAPSAGDSRERPDRPDYYSDDHLWPVLAVCEYVKETGNVGFLDREVPFYAPGSGRANGSAPVLEHLRRAVAFTQKDVGAHGLPLLGFADWNDTVNLAQGAESCFTACLFGKAVTELAALEAFAGHSQPAEAWQHAYGEMKDRFEAAAWDGEWYRRYFDADGTPLGSAGNRNGRIFLNAQSWPVIAGFAAPDRARRALDAARKYLNTPRGLKLSWPGYQGFDPAVGGVTTYPPGAKENGGIFLHSNPWVMVAETLVGRGDRAFEYYDQINPAARNAEIEVFECEPYAYPQNILGDEHPQFGLARNSWLSGTAAWCHVAATRYILGIRPTYRGLEIDPCLPGSWKGYSARRVYRQATYAIVVRNPKGISKGVARVLCDGVPVGGGVLPIAPAGSVVQVEVEMGAA